MTTTLKDKRPPTSRLLLFGLATILMLALGIWAIITMSSQAEEHAQTELPPTTSEPSVPPIDPEDPTNPNIDEGGKIEEGHYDIPDSNERNKQTNKALSLINQLCPTNTRTAEEATETNKILLSEARFVTPRAEMFINGRYHTRQCTNTELTLLTPSQLEPDVQGIYYAAYTVNYKEAATPTITPLAKIAQIVFEFSEDGILYLDVQ